MGKSPVAGSTYIMQERGEGLCRVPARENDLDALAGAEAGNCDTVVRTRVRHRLGFPDRLLDACQLSLHSRSIGAGPTRTHQVLLCPRLARSRQQEPPRRVWQPELHRTQTPREPPLTLSSPSPQPVLFPSGSAQGVPGFARMPALIE